MKKIVLFLMLAVFAGFSTYAQRDVSKMTKDDILELSYDDLLSMPFEDLLTLANKLGVSTDDLFAMIMNKSVSSASKKAEDSFKSPLASTVITKAEIRSYGITSIEEALRLVPGMIVQEKTNGMYDVHIRGLNNIPDNQMMLYTENSNILLMIDGRIAHNYATGNLNFDILPIGIEDIERIEVVRGANAALYGPNAVTGVINIITEKPGENSKELQGSLTMGTHENYIGDVAYRKNINKKLSVGVTANMQYRRRSTNDLYVYPTQGLFYAKKSGLVDASEGGYYSTTDIKNLKQAFSFGAIAGEVPEELKAKILQIQKQKGADYMMENYGVAEPSEATVAMFLKGLADSLPYAFYNAMENQGDIYEMFDDPGMSRKTYGFNGYLNFTPNSDMNFDVSVGYQDSRAGATPIGEIPFLLCERTSKTGYFTLNSNIYGLSLNASYMGGIQDFQKGKPGFKVFVNNVQVNAEYDIKLGDLSIMPGVAYNYVKQTDYIPDYVNPQNPNDYSWEYHDHDYKFPTGRHLSGSQGGKDAELKNFAPSLRLDYKIGDFRAVGAVRFDKTNLPDEWNTSYQVAANYSINENNLVRASYGTAMRSANLINSIADYTWHRDGLMPPDTIYFKGDKDAPLAKTKNAEIGYRWRPTENILIDAEAYYSVSEDFGALKANRSSVIMPTGSIEDHTGILGFMTDTANLGALNDLKNYKLNMTVLTKFMGESGIISTIKYSELPYKVKQMGFGVNIDWIISKKLIAKVNANIQQTTIDNYYVYNQNAEILGQLGQIFGMITEVPDLIYDIQYDAIQNLMDRGVFTDEDQNTFLTDPQKFFAYLMEYQSNLKRAVTDIDDVEALKAEYASLDEAGKEQMKAELRGSDDAQKYASYYALQYGTYSQDGTFYFGNSKAYETATENGHKHKATPSFYGMVGLIYKPTPKIDITAYGNYIGKRTYATKYNMGDNAVELKDRFTVSMKLGYRPVEGLEVYLSGHNLFNNEQREFPYGDNIGGIYSIGINFGF